MGTRPFAPWRGGSLRREAKQIDMCPEKSPLHVKIHACAFIFNNTGPFC